MHEYDTALKLLLQSPTGSVLRQITGLTVARWLNVEMQQVQVSRADLLGATVDDQILHVELQSSNDPEMALRMAEYSLQVYRQFRQFPKQVVLYVGEAKLRMSTALSGPDPLKPAFAFEYTLLDFRELDGNALLESGHIEDNLLAILANLKDKHAAVRTILRRIAGLDEHEQRVALAKFLILSGLRHLGAAVREEVRNMPITESILDHDLLGPEIRKGIQQGRQEGRRELLRAILEKRFGTVPNWVENRLVISPSEELDKIAVRAFDASSLEELFPAL